MVQTSFFDDRTKEERFYSVFDQIFNEKHISFLDWNLRHHVYHYRTINNDISIWQLAKEQEYEKPMPGEEKIENVFDVKSPFVFLIFHKTRQLVLIEHNSSVFSKLDTTKAKLERFFSQNENIASGSISVSLIEISDQREFWVQAEELDFVEQVEFDYNPPNFFRGEREVDRLVKDVHEETNFKKFKIFLQNKYDGLLFKAGTFADHISRLAAGAGTFVVKGFKNGVEKTLSTFNIPAKKAIENIDTVNEEELEDDFKQIDDLNKPQ